MSSKPTLGYWNIRGFGQPIRFLLAYLNVDYEEKTYRQEIDGEWFNEKFSLGLDFPNIPYWIDEKVKLTEKVAILKYLARKYNPTLIPSADKLWEAEMLEGVLQDVWQLLVAICYAPSDQAEEIFKTTTPLKLEQLNKFIGESSFFTGNNPSYIDFMAYEVFHHLGVHNDQVQESNPNTVKFMKNFEDLPAIAAYMKSPAFIQGPCFSKYQQKYHI